MHARNHVFMQRSTFTLILLDITNSKESENFNGYKIVHYSKFSSNESFGPIVLANESETQKDSGAPKMAILILCSFCVLT